MTTVLVWLLSLVMVALAAFLLYCVVRLALLSLRRDSNTDQGRDS